MTCKILKNYKKIIGISLLIFFLSTSFVYAQKNLNVLAKQSEEPKNDSPNVQPVNNVGDNEISPNVNTRKTSSGNIRIKEVRILNVTSNENKQDKIKYYRQALNLSEKIQINDESVEKLMERKNVDYTNFQKITQISNNLVLSEDREIFVNELIDMDKEFTDEFTERFSKDQLQEKIKIREQVDNYILSLKNTKEIKLEIDTLKIESLFKGSIDIDSFINLIWT
jgi:hypothetical protein